MRDWTDGYPYRVTTALAGGDIGPARRCQFPVGGQGAGIRFCGRISQRGTSYCARHLRRCVAPVGNETGETAGGAELRGRSCADAVR